MTGKYVSRIEKKALSKLGEKFGDCFMEDCDIKIFVHTVNDEAEARQRLTEGVSGIYSDVILPGEFEGWRQEVKEREPESTGDM